MLAAVAAATEGFAGADLQALCSSAVHAAVRRAAPSLLDDLDDLIAARPSATTPSGPSAIPFAIPTAIPGSKSIPTLGLIGEQGQPAPSLIHPPLSKSSATETGGLKCLPEKDDLHPAGAEGTPRETGTEGASTEQYGSAAEVLIPDEGPHLSSAAVQSLTAGQASGVAEGGGEGVAATKVSLEEDSGVAPPSRVEQLLDCVKVRNPPFP